MTAIYIVKHFLYFTPTKNLQIHVGRFYVPSSMLARVGRLLAYNCRIANHSNQCNHTTRPALLFSSINSFSFSRGGNEIDVTIHRDDWSKTFYWPDALPAAKLPMEVTHYQYACGQWGG